VKISTVLLLGFAAAYAQTTPPDRPRNEIEINATVSIPSGNANFSGTTGSGNTLDFSRDFDFKNEFGFDLRYIYRSESDKHKFLAEYAHTDWSRSTVITRSFTFLGQTYVANATVTGDLTLHAFRGMYSYRWGNPKFRIGPMVDLGAIHTDLDITGTTTNGTQTREGSMSKFYATVGYDLDYNPSPKINIYNNLGAIAFQGEHFFHVDGGVKYFPGRHFGINGGYKAVRYKLKDNDNVLNIRTHGPFFGGVFRF
jgi:hypothetical protein